MIIGQGHKGLLSCSSVLYTCAPPILPVVYILFQIVFICLFILIKNKKTDIYTIVVKY